MTGAALLAGRAGLAGGAGRVYVSLLDDHPPLDCDPVHPELMFRRPVAGRLRTCWKRHRGVRMRRRRDRSPGAA
jgi:NAD(P)H-hydrate repair Nnr-like enzyme with NAD(P)H-hydrate dehydratase domain